MRTRMQNYKKMIAMLLPSFFNKLANKLAFSYDS